MPPSAGAWHLELATGHGWRVRLWIDDPTPLRKLAPDYAAGPVEVCLWPEPWPDPRPEDDTAEVVIEAFACETPPAYVESRRPGSAGRLAQPRVPLGRSLGRRLPRPAVAASAPAAGQAFLLSRLRCRHRRALARTRLRRAAQGLRRGRFPQRNRPARGRETGEVHDIPVQLSQPGASGPDRGLGGMGDPAMSRPACCVPAAAKPAEPLAA